MGNRFARLSLGAGVGRPGVANLTASSVLETYCEDALIRLIRRFNQALQDGLGGSGVNCCGCLLCG